jgi:5S rRNA maturation endonuclease (ribonuclease M5)
MNIHNFLHLLETKVSHMPKKSGGNYLSCCPAHEDSTPSLSISEGSDGRVLVNCFSGCAPEEVCASLGIKIADLFPANLTSEEVGSKTRIAYPYQDEQGAVLFSKIRIEPGLDGKTKSFYWERIDKGGQIIRNLNGCRKVLYRLPELLKGIREKEMIFLVEGEKDADKLAGYGLIATTAPESLKWYQEFSSLLQQADVVILYDLDKTGLERRDLLCKNLQGKVNRLRVVDLPGLEYQESHGKDVSDWLSMGNTIVQLLEIVSRTSDYAPKEKFRAISMDEFLNMKLPKREMLLEPFLPTQGVCLLYARRGGGKTHVALGIGYAVATGGVFLKWKAPKPKRVLYVDGEMPAAAMQERLQRIHATEDLKPPSPDFFRIMTQDLQGEPMPDLSTKEGRQALEKFILDSDLIIIDNISTLFRSGVENEAESWQPVQDWALELRRRGKSVLFIHHAGKGGQQRGTSKREDILDAVITLKQPEGYSPKQGAAFEVNFEKTRHFAGDDAAPFHVRLVEQDDGLWIWEIDEPIPDEEIVKVAQAAKEGLTIDQIRQKTGLSKSQVETRKKKAKSQGLI